MFLFSNLRSKLLTDDASKNVCDVDHFDLNNFGFGSKNLTLTHNLSHKYIQNTSFFPNLNNGKDVTKYDVINSKINLFIPALENQLRFKI